jgi:hypothetical protein
VENTFIGTSELEDEDLQSILLQSKATSSSSSTQNSTLSSPENEEHSSVR